MQTKLMLSCLVAQSAVLRQLRRYEICLTELSPETSYALCSQLWCSCLIRETVFLSVCLCLLFYKRGTAETEFCWASWFKIHFHLWDHFTNVTVIFPITHVIWEGVSLLDLAHGHNLREQQSMCWFIMWLFTFIARLSLCIGRNCTKLSEHG